MNDIRKTDRQSLWSLRESMRYGTNFDIFVERYNGEIGKNRLSVNTQDGIGNTLLHYAVMSQRLDIVKFLLEQGANSDIANEGMFSRCENNIGKLAPGETPVQLAEKDCLPEIYSALTGGKILNISSQADNSSVKAGRAI